MHSLSLSLSLTHTHTHPRFAHRQNITAFAFHPTEKCVVYGDSVGEIWRDYCLDGITTSRRRLDKFHWHTLQVNALSFTPDGAYMLSGGLEVEYYFISELDQC